MKIEVFDRADVVQDELNNKEYARVQLILEGLGSLDGIDTSYTIYGEAESNEVVATYLHKNGLDSLPLTYINGELVKTATYLTDDEFMAYTGISFVIEENSDNHQSCHYGECCCGHRH